MCGNQSSTIYHKRQTHSTKRLWSQETTKKKKFYLLLKKIEHKCINQRTKKKYWLTISLALRNPKAKKPATSLRLLAGVSPVLSSLEDRWRSIYATVCRSIRALITEATTGSCGHPSCAAAMSISVFDLGWHTWQSRALTVGDPPKSCNPLAFLR